MLPRISIITPGVAGSDVMPERLHGIRPDGIDIPEAPQATGDVFQPGG